MSIFQIGVYSRQLQASPGCRKYINPFLSHSERQQIQNYKEQNQNQYREILLQQMKEKQRQKLIKKKKQEEEDLKHERDFYQQIQKYQARDAKSRNAKLRIAGGSMPRMSDSYDSYDKNIFKKSTAQPSFPPLHSSLIFPQKNSRIQGASIFTPDPSAHESNYLKYNSLMDIGNKIKQGKMGRSVTLQNEEYEFEDRRIQKFKERVEKGFHRPEKGYMQLKMQLKEQSSEVYDLIQKSSHLSKSTKSPIRQIKKRLKTMHVYIPSDDQQEEEGYKKPLRYRIRTQFGTRHREDYDDIFYRLPSLPNLDWTSSRATNSIDQEQTIMPRQITNEMIMIEENPENQFLEETLENNKISVRLGNEVQNIEHGFE